MKRAYIKWIPTAERKPDGFGMYLVTVKKYAPGDPLKTGARSTVIVRYAARVTS